MSRMQRRALLHGLIGQMQQTAASIIASSREHASILVLLTPGQVAVEPLTVAAHERLNDVLRQRLQAVDAWGYLYVNEAWTTRAVGPIVRGDVSRVLDLPRADRQEELIMVGRLKGEAPQVFGAVIEATPTGRRLGPWQARAPALFLGDASVVPTW